MSDCFKAGGGCRGIADGEAGAKSSKPAALIERGAEGPYLPEGLSNGALPQIF
jgi:hypothetical protein